MLKVEIKKSLSGFNLNIDFSVNKEILAILGPSGAGKTMTLKCIAGLIQPDEGFIELNGKVFFNSVARVNLPAQQRKVGFVFQNYALFPHLNVYENVAFGLRVDRKQTIKDRVLWLLDKMHIQGLSQRYPRQLSSGQQQRVALARALSREPEALLLDEPFSALDLPRRERLERELLSMQDFYKGDILFVTHDLAQGYKLGSRIAVYESGRVVQCDYKSNVISSPTNRTVARLTGFKNLIDGNITSIGNQDVQVTIPELNQKLKIAIASPSNLSLNQRVTIGIRPEHVRISDPLEENTITGLLTQVLEGVTSINYFFKPGAKGGSEYDIEACLSRSDGFPLSEGKIYNLYLPPDRLVIIKE